MESHHVIFGDSGRGGTRSQSRLAARTGAAEVAARVPTGNGRSDSGKRDDRHAAKAGGSLGADRPTAQHRSGVLLDLLHNREKGSGAIPAGDESEGVEFLCEIPKIQNGRNGHDGAADRAGRLFDDDRHIRCVQPCGDSQGVPGSVQVSIPRSDVQNVGHAVWIRASASAVHEVDAPSGHTTENNGHSLRDLSRRFIDYGQDSGAVSERDAASGRPLAQARIRTVGGEVPVGATERGDVLGFCRGQQTHDGFVSTREDQESYASGAPSTGRKVDSERTRESDWQAKRNLFGGGTGQTVLQTPVKMPGGFSGPTTKLGGTVAVVGRSDRRARLVAGGIIHVERQADLAASSHNGSYDRREWSGLGSMDFRAVRDRGAYSGDARVLVTSRWKAFEQLQRVDDRPASFVGVSQSVARAFDLVENGQPHHGGVRESERRSIASAAEASVIDMGGSVGERSSIVLPAPSRGLERASGQTVQSVKRQGRLQIEPGAVRQDFRDVRSVSAGAIRHIHEQTVGEVLQWAAGPNGGSGGRVRTEVGRPLLRQPAVRSDSQGVVEDPARTSSGGGADFASVAIGRMVPGTIGAADGPSIVAPRQRGLVLAGPPRLGEAHRQGTVASGRLQSVRVGLQTAGLSAAAQELFMAQHRTGTVKAYDTCWKKWTKFCLDHNVANPLLPTAVTLANFLASLFEADLRPSTVANYRSAVVSTAAMLDSSFLHLSKEPFVHGVMKAMEALRPSIPKYDDHWEADLLPLYWQGQEDNEELVLSRLMDKALSLLMLCAVMRSSDAHRMIMDSVRFVGDTLRFRILDAKNIRGISDAVTVARIRELPKICPVRAMECWIRRSGPFRKSQDQKERMWLAANAAKGPISVRTIAKRVLMVMKAAGVDTTVFKVHSIRGAAVTKAVEAGQSREEIMAHARWKSSSVFEKYYNRSKAKTIVSRVIAVPVIARL
eukprot:TRINITY_DN3636_c0_g1_i1.p1 TRINITY_DN3636_c0_g1~~TRINITY_DN3636_c0_g1_i1.p1  ORF type:complete len:1059 (+),score=66.35 TRINITY_DN3636_c0_g1_i1:334-3177(+)